MLGYLSLDIIRSSSVTVFLELRSRKNVRYSEQIMSADKYPSIFSRQMVAIVYIIPNFQITRVEKNIKGKDNNKNKHNSLYINLNKKRMTRYLSLDIICSSDLTLFLEHRSRSSRAVRFWEQLISTDKFLNKFSNPNGKKKLYIQKKRQQQRQ